MKVGEYNRTAAIAYARQWALGRNPGFLSFDGIGGDCTNFVSQCLYAGVGEMNYKPVYGWYYTSGYKRTASWTGVEFLYAFLMNNNGSGPRARLVDISRAQPGDVTQIGHANGDFYHTQLVVARNASEVYIAAHSDDAWMRPLSDYRAAQIRCLQILDSPGSGR